MLMQETEYHTNVLGLHSLKKNQLHRIEKLHMLGKEHIEGRENLQANNYCIVYITPHPDLPRTKYILVWKPRGKKICVDASKFPFFLVPSQPPKREVCALPGTQINSEK